MQKKLQTTHFKPQKTIAFAFVLLALLFSKNLLAQTPITVGTGTSASGANVLFSTNTGGNLWSKSASLYTATEILNAGGTPGNITKIAFNKQGTGEYNFGDANMRIYIKAVSKADQSGSSLDWATNLGTATPLFSSTTFSFMSGTGWQEFTLQTPFLWDGTSNIEVLTAFHHPTTLTASMTWQYTVATNMNMSRVNSTEIGSQTLFLQSNRPNIQFTIIPATACTTPPNAGNATASTTSICSGGSFNLNLNGASFGSGQTYIWERSANGTTGWTPISTSAISPAFTTSQTAGTFFYRAQVTCSGQTAVSQPVSVTSPALISGTYTINDKIPASATNFQSFTAAINSLSCGIGGTVTFNVDPASGPYTEQLEIPAITGMSATNKIIIQGNGRTINGDPVSANRSVIKLNGATYVTINNLNIETTGTSTSAYGWGIHFTNGADNNTISNNTITIGSLSVTESNSVGIVFTNSATSVTTAGGNNGNNNVISGNTIIGGYKGLHLNGVETNAGNNQITGNTIRDFYSYGMEINGLNGTLIEGNNISRPNRLTVTSFYGIYLSGTTQNSVVNKNRIHNSHGAATSTTGSVFGIYSISNDAPVGSENIVKNNLVYNINNTTGNINALYNSGSDGVYYFNNTIVLSNAAHTGIARGLYQTLAATNLKLINNNIVITTTGVAANLQAIYLNTATTVLQSNNNNLYVPTGNTGFYNATNYLTLANWQAANTTAPFDVNSVTLDPMFASAATGNFMPTNSALNNAGQPLTAVTHDINGNPRNATTPDIGAYEFTPGSLDLGLTALVTPGTKNCYSASEPVTVTVRNFGSTPADFAAITANVTITVTGAVTPTPLTIVLTNAMNGGQPLAAGSTVNVTVGNLNMTTAGTYTINGTIAVTAGGTDGNPSNNALTATTLTVSPVAAGTAAATTSQLCGSGTTTINLTGNTGGDIQWQQGATATGPFTNITGANQASYTLGTPITQTTYYQAVISCGTSNATSNLVTITVNPTPATPTVTRAGSLLTSSSATGNQWYLNGTAISGATSQTYTATASGTYTVVVTTSNCLSAPSAGVAFVTGLGNAMAGMSIEVYPNPATGSFNVKLNGYQKDANVVLYSLTGQQQIAETAPADGNVRTISLKGLAAGTYLLKVTSDKGVQVTRLIVE